MSRDRAAGRLTGDDGAAVVEAAIITPVIFLLIFGILEFGVIYRDYHTVGDATTAGARSGAIVGPGVAKIAVDDGSGGETIINANGDFAIMKAVRESMVAVPIDWIDRIVVFRVAPSQAGVADPTSLINASCRTGTASASGCNLYDPRPAFEALEGTVSDVDLDYFECMAPGDPACGWPPDDRCNGESSHCPAVAGTPTSANIDYLGVYIKVDREYLTGIFGDSFTFEQSYVLRIEPGDVGS